MKREDVWKLSDRCGGVFKFTVLLQKRIRELVKGAPPLLEDTGGLGFIEIALREIKEGLIELKPLSQEELEQMRAQLHEQAAAQSLLSKGEEGRPGEPSTQAASEFLKS